MALPTNEGDFANCELSIDELEAIAAGWPHWLKTIGNAVESVLTLPAHHWKAAGIAGGVEIAAAAAVILLA